MEGNNKNHIGVVVAIAIVTGSLFGAATGFFAGYATGTDTGLGSLVERALNNRQPAAVTEERTQSDRTVATIDQESAVVSVVEKVSPSVVSIIVTKELPVFNSGSSDFFRRFFGDDFGEMLGEPEVRERETERREVGGGSGFIVSPDGYILTNRHVVDDEDADYTVLMNDGSRHEAAVLARDQLIDVAILKIEGDNFPSVELGSSDNLKVGQTVVAIGNSLGEFSNTVSTGVISGLSRSVTAGGLRFGGSELLLGVIQTDASINPGNSGGPLLNIAGQVIGINTAMAEGAENIGFALPVDMVKNTYVSVKENGRIIRPWLGVRYVLINEAIKEDNRLGVDHGALIVRGEERTDLAVIPGSPADKAGLKENDIILEIDGTRIDEDNPLANEIARFKPGDEAELKILRQGEETTVSVKLEEMK